MCHSLDKAVSNRGLAVTTVPYLFLIKNLFCPKGYINLENITLLIPLKVVVLVSMAIKLLAKFLFNVNIALTTVWLASWS